MGYSQMHVSRLLARALETLRSHVRIRTSLSPRRNEFLVGHPGLVSATAAEGRKLALSNLRRCCVGPPQRPLQALEGPATIRISSVRLSRTGDGSLLSDVVADLGRWVNFSMVDTNRRLAHALGDLAVKMQAEQGGEATLHAGVTAAADVTPSIPATSRP